MLHQKAIDPPILELLKSLQKEEYLKNFYLVGGTALSLYYGHRKSNDIDLFTNLSFDVEYLLEKLIQDFSYQLDYSAKQTLKGSVSEIKVDIIAHAYPYLQKPRASEGIFLLSEKDIIAMKLNAISISGQRRKDFIDIYYALNHFSIADMLSFYKEKYKQQNPSYILKSLVYFDDTDLSDWPVMIKDPDLKWHEIKKKLEREVIALLKENP